MTATDPVTAMIESYVNDSKVIAETTKVRKDKETALRGLLAFPDFLNDAQREAITAALPTPRAPRKPKGDADAA